MTAQAGSPDFFTRHRELLERAVRATTERASWSAYPEMPNDPAYGEGAMAAGEAAFEAPRAPGRRVSRSRPARSRRTGRNSA